MVLIWILFIVLLIWYGRKESRKSRPNWARAFVSAALWPITPFIRWSTPEEHNKNDI